MYFLEEEESYGEDEISILIQEAVNDPINNDLRTFIIDPIIKVLEKPAGKTQYIKYGSEFLEANAEMLSKEYPTKQVSFPKGYVDNIFMLFGFDAKPFKDILKQLLKQVSDKTDFQTIIATPTNVIHSVVLFYSDMILHRQLRDSARQQMGLTIYHNVFNKFFHPPHPTEQIMSYTYMTLDNSWNLVKSENVINWIGNTIETAYGFYKTSISLDMSMSVLVKFLNRVRTSFQQNLRLLAHQYFDNLEKGNMAGDDVDSSEEYLDTKDTVSLRNNLLRKIKTGDELYARKGNLYIGIARIKNVKVDDLYNLAMKMEHSDISKIMDAIFYVFIVKEANTINDINSSKFISRITNLPTAVDRAMQGRPLIYPLAHKYGVDISIIKAYICLIATYILDRTNDSK
jgi:hypothetical protein